MTEKLAILDCGGQYTKVIDRKIRELGVLSDIFPMGVEISKLADYDAIVFSGGPSSVWEKGAPEYDKNIFDLGKPMLGICYGMQLIVNHFGGKVMPEVKTEYGQIEIDTDTSCPLFHGLKNKETVLMSHGDAVKEMAEGFSVVATTSGVVAGVYNESRKIVGVQFHPEVELTENGITMIDNFLRKICEFKEVYALDDRIATSIEASQTKVGDKKVMVLVSGGVDSAVSAALLVRALPPEKVYAIHVDHGLMRKDESDVICANLAELGLVNMLRMNTEKEFFETPLKIGDVQHKPLNDTCEPEAKRSIIGHMFIEVTRTAAESLGLDFDTTFLAQGTLRPDLIESGNPDVSGYAHKIKTHHNDVDIVRRAREKGMIIETNWDWHKDEVRKVAMMLGLSEDVAMRQPFPGPGLGVRILCTDEGAVTDESLNVKIREFLATQTDKITATIAPIKSVGVQGDNRSYRSLAILDGQGLDCDFAQIRELAKMIPNELNFVNRVAYLINREKIGGEVVSVRSRICHDTAELLREVDHIVTSEIMNKKIAQCFAVLVPASTNGKYSIAVRAVVTNDFMTARSAVPGVDFPADALANIVRRIRETNIDVDMIMYDVTGKPPATVEWE